MIDTRVDELEILLAIDSVCNLPEQLAGPGWACGLPAWTHVSIECGHTLDGRKPKLRPDELVVGWVCRDHNRALLRRQIPHLNGCGCFVWRR